MDISEITIIVPTKNETRNIPRFLASLPPEARLALVDASSDETIDLALRLRPHNTVAHRSPARIAEARNIGGRAARTPWLLFTDADVAFAPGYFAHLARIHPGGAVYGAKQSVGEYAAYYRSFSHWQARLDRLGIPAASGSNFLIEKQVFDAVGGFDPLLWVNEDTEIGYRIKRAGYPIHFDPALSVLAFDHRRLKNGTLRKDLHTLARCLLIYLNWFPGIWRKNDWGYWSKQGGKG